ncbi:MAG TPA: cytidine deaminase [Thermoleophilia bacterium]|nr:cytidine deaminase [Thermoleophilia bacterium]
MREDQLSPTLGRLIDAAKAALSAGAAPDEPAEAVALLAESGAIFTGRSAGNPSAGGCRAAHIALGAHVAAGGGQIDAAALAAHPSRESVFPCEECLGALTELDPDLPLVVKQLGRWVLLPVSTVTGGR